MNRINIWLGGIIGLIAMTSPATAITQLSLQPQASIPDQSGVLIAGLIRVLDVAEDVDDLAKGNIRGIDPVKNVTRDVEDAFDDTRDTVEDFGDDVGDSVRDVNRAIDRAADDVNDWFD